MDDLLRRLEDRVSEFTLANGLHFIVLERHTSPVVSCHTYADVGSFDEPAGQTGIQKCCCSALQVAQSSKLGLIGLGLVKSKVCLPWTKQLHSSGLNCLYAPDSNLAMTLEGPGHQA